MVFDFANEDTQVILERKLLPVLEELARAEFGPVCFYGDVDESDSKFMCESIETIERCVGVYFRGLMELYLKYGQFVTEESSQQHQSQTEPMLETQPQEPI